MYSVQLKGKEMKTTCPACGRRKTFSPYVFTDTGRPVDASVCGKCDRLDNCGYHLTPKQYFKQHPGARDHNRRQGAPVAAPPKARPATFIPRDTMLMTVIADRGANPLYRFIRNELYFKKPMGHIIEDVFENYAVGTSPHFGGSAVFWQVDAVGRVRDGKVMGFDPTTGKRIKKPFPQVNWATSLLKISDANPVRTFFGARMAWRRPEATLIVVESEKTALQLAIMLRFTLGEYAFDRYVPIAAGGCEGLRCGDFDRDMPLHKNRVLKGRDVVLLPDRGCYDKWRTIAAEFKDARWCRSIRTSRLMESPPANMAANPGDDIEDLIVRALLAETMDVRLAFHSLIAAL